MNWEISWADMCRACMEAEGELFPLYDDGCETNENDLSNKLAELTSIEISRCDGLPTKLCAKCIDKTTAFFEFKSLVQDSDKKLRYMFDKQEDQIDDQIETIETEYNEPVDSLTKECQNNRNCKQVVCNDKSNDTISQSSQEKFTDTGVDIIEDLQKVCDTVILNVQENPDGANDEMQMHVVFQTSDYNTINVSNESQLIENQSNFDEMQESDNLSTKESPNKNDEYDDILEAAVQIITEDSKLNNINLENDDSDSDCYTNSQDNIVGSLNDTITKVKEIKENGKIIQYQCTLCLQDYPVLAEALCHIVDLHVPKTGPFYCVVCEMDCSSIKQLRTHVKTHKGPSPYKCFLCNKSYVMKRYLKRHMACHTDFPRHRCAKCGERFKVKSELESHISSHSSGAAFKCSQCPREFNHKGNYKRHLISHLDPQGVHLPKFPCSVCNRRFLNNRTLVTHMRVHTGEKPYKCSTCNKSFSQQGNLLNHRKIHTNPRSFTCEVCGKSFNQKATLRDHSLLHSGEKPYVCTICGSAFTFSAALRRHMWSHSDGKPFECNVCNAKFIGRYDLRRHMTIHNGKPRLRRPKTSKSSKSKEDIVVPDEVINIVEDSSNANNTIFVEQIFLCENDSIQIISHEDSEKENVDSILGLIEYA